MILPALTACGGRSLDADSYISYMEDPSHGMRITRSMQDMQFTAQYKPVDMLLARKIRSESGMGDISVYRTGTDSLQRFEFYITAADGAEHPYRYHTGSPAEYNDRRFYYEFGEVAGAFYIETPSGKVYPFLCRSEQNGTMGNVLVLECLFALPLPQEDLVLCFDDQIFGKGIIRFRFDTEKIRHLPTLKYNEKDEKI